MNMSQLKKFLIAIAFAGLNGFALASPPSTPGGWTTVLDDDFDTLSVGTSGSTTWYPRTGTKNNSTCVAENITATNGVLNLKVHKHDGSYYCAGVITNDLFKYGFYEISAKLPDAKGWHPAFWMYGDEQEIDAFEFNTGISTNGMSVGLHDYEPGLPTESWPSTAISLPFDPASAFHTYAAEWNPFVLRYFVDGNLVDIKTFPEDTTDNHGDQELWLSVIKSNDSTVVDDDLPAYFQIDSATIWERNDEDGPDTPLSLMFAFDLNTTSAPDGSDKGHVGNLIGSTTYSVDSMVGPYSATFGSSGDYVEVDDHESLDDTSAMTISAWLKPANADNSLKGIVSKRNNLSDCAYLVFARNGKVYVDINAYDGTQRVSTSSAVLPGNEWKHLTVVYDGEASTSKVKIFINGTEQSTSGTETDTSIGNCTADLHIGSFNDRSESFNGKIDDLRIWKRALTEGEIELLQSTVQLSLQFEDGNRMVANDHSGNGNNGLLKNAWWTGSSKNGDHAIEFLNRGYESFVKISDSDDLDGTSELTVMAWVKPYSVDTTARGLFCKRQSYITENAYSIFFIDSDEDGAADISVDIDGFDGPQRTTAPEALSPNGSGVWEWTHVAITFDGAAANKVKIYINGDLELASTSETSTSIPNADSDLIIGSMQESNGASFQGLMDDVRVFQDALTESEIELEMNR